MMWLFNVKCGHLSFFPKSLITLYLGHNTVGITLVSQRDVHHIQLLTDNSRAPTQANQKNWVMGCIGWFTSCSSGTHPLFLRTEIGSKLDRNGYWYLDAVILLPELVQSYGSVSHVDSTPDALFFHVNSAHWTGQPFSNISTDTRPKRLINISKTLLTRGGVFFSEAESWDFHVISHTWSADLRNFSKEIAQKIGVGDDCSYESLFRKTDFSKEPGYQSLMNLLRILQSDGVEDVWLDALCINQEDNDEKSHEIAHMGAFYMHSKGCYVNTHGIGKGYKLAVKNKDGGYSIARWFTRAWTLQEYILPRTLTFLVGSLPERLKHLVNHCIINTSHHMVCKCNFSEMEKILAHTLSLAIESFAFMDPRAKINEIIGSDEVVPCCKCAKLPFIRKANLARSGNQSELFFIERLFYGFLLRCFHFCIVRQEDNNHMHLPMQNVHESHQSILQELSIPLYGIDAWGGKVHELERLIKVCDFCRSEGFYLGAIKGRDATHEEDFVLSIMALLGVEGRMQVRTDKSLVQQFVELAKVASPGLLVEICTNCINPSRELSWIPDICHVPCSHLPLSYKPFMKGKIQAAIVKEGLTPQGFLSLRGKVTQARLVFEKNSIHLHDATDSVSICMACNGMLNAPGCPDTNLSSRKKKEKISHVHARCFMEVPNASPWSKLPLEGNFFIGVQHRHGIIVTHRGESTYEQNDDEYFPYTDGGLCIEGYENIQDIMQYPIDVYMLLMGERYHDVDGYQVPLGMRSKVVMVCIGTLQNLHKIGVIKMDSMSSAGFFSSKLNPAVMSTSYNIGWICVHRFWQFMAFLLLPFRQKHPCKNCNYWCDRSFRLAFATACTPPPRYRPYRTDRPFATSCSGCGRVHIRSFETKMA